MIFEWYSGSDTSSWIPGELDNYRRNRDDLAQTQRLDMLVNALAREQDRNWCGAIRYLIGDEHFLEGEKDRGLGEFARAEKDFDPFAANFRDVGEQYCRTLYRLIGHHYLEPGSAERVVDWGTRIVQSLSPQWLYDFERFMLFTYLGGAFNTLGTTLKLQWCYKVALAYYYSAHHLDPNEPSCLEWITYCHFNLDDLASCKATYDVFLKVAQGYEHTGRVEEFMRTRVGLTGGQGA